MKKSSTFTQLLCVFLAITLVFVVFMFSLLYINIRSARLDARLTQLKMQAKDVAFLAGKLQNTIWYATGNENSLTTDYLYQKTSSVYSQFSAYTLIVARDGRVYSYYYENALENESLRMVPSGSELSGYLTRASQGEEIIVETSSREGPLFTVIVPWMQTSTLTQEKTVMGIVMIQTAPQTVKDIYDGLVLPLVLSALGVFLLVAVSTYFITRHFTRPITVMADIASEFAKGNFAKRASPTGSSEIARLAASFNHMADQLSTTEQSRRDFLANVSHELRSPITSIQGFAQGMLDGTVKETDREHCLNIIVDETRRLNKLIASLLNLSRMENDQVALALSDFDINELIRRTIISRITQLEEKSLEVEPFFEQESCYVSADQEQIQQVLINLIDNAIKYTPSGGQISISTSVEDGLVRVHVKDNGIGISSEDALHIFDRFYKADKSHTVGKGTGLGLSICKIIMEKHHQQIRLVSGQGGADFEFTLKPGIAPESKGKIE